jgi:hypothetical protein
MESYNYFKLHSIEHFLSNNFDIKLIAIDGFINKSEFFEKIWDISTKSSKVQMIVIKYLRATWYYYIIYYIKI